MWFAGLSFLYLPLHPQYKTKDYKKVAPWNKFSTGQFLAKRHEYYYSLHLHTTSPIYRLKGSI